MGENSAMYERERMYPATINFRFFAASTATTTAACASAPNAAPPTTLRKNMSDLCEHICEFLPNIMTNITTKNKKIHEKIRKLPDFLAARGAALARVRPLPQGGREGDAKVRHQQLPGTERVIDFDCKSITGKF